MIFVDTGAWFAAFVPGDPDHLSARAWLTQNSELLITTDYIFDELLTLLLARNESQRAMRVGEALLHEGIAQLEWVRSEDVEQAFLTFRHYQDKGWSFTDCVSRTVMQRLRVTTAFAFDTHFRQFGGVSVVPTVS